MRLAVVGPWALCVTGCTAAWWSMPQPVLAVQPTAGAWARSVTAVNEHCGGVETAQEDTSIILGRWVRWETNEGLILTRCVLAVSSSPEGAQPRLSFSARRCAHREYNPSSSEAFAAACEVTETVPESVKNGLVTTSQALEQSFKK
jgi:hypothetical protein